MQYDICTAGGAVAFLHGVARRAVALPAHGLCAFLITQGADSNLVGHHERRVKSETEVAYDSLSIVFILGEEVFCSRESNLVDILVDLFSGHADAVVTHSERAGFLVDGNGYLEVACITLEVAEVGKSAEFLAGVDSIRHQFAEKNLMVAVEEFLDYRKDILGTYSYCAFLHSM